MDRQQTLLKLAQQISTATAASDWKALEAVNTMMASALPTMAAQGRWTPAELAALTALRQMHDQSVLHCQQTSIEMSKHLSEMQTNKEGWIAYALDSDSAATGLSA